MNITLLNEAGINVMFHQQSKLLQCTPAGYYPVYHTFSINSIMIDGRKSTLDLWREEYITLPPKSKCQINITIPQIWKPEPNRPTPPDRPDKSENVTPVLVGNYKLMVSLGISKRNSKSERVSTEPVALKYLD
jgi:hypothetical protein